MNGWRWQLNLFFNALTFFTRIPCPKWVEHSSASMRHASRYFPWVGVLIGLIGAAVYWVSAQFLAPSIAILLALSSTILATGAFHEDGWADMCDGFGGGWQPEQILNIMKDSRLGTYGALGLVIMLGLRFLALNETALVIPALLCGHVFSRWFAISLIYTGSYVSANPASKSKAFAMSLSRKELCIAAIPCLALLPWLHLASLWILAALIVVRFLFEKWINKRLGGYTGDCLGGCQQLCEISILLGFAISAPL